MDPPIKSVIAKPTTTIIPEDSIAEKIVEKIVKKNRNLFVPLRRWAAIHRPGPLSRASLKGSFPGENSTR